MSLVLKATTFEQVSIVLWDFFCNEKFLDALIENFLLHEKFFVVVEAKAGHFLALMLPSHLKNETPTVRGLAADNNNKLYTETMIFL